MTDRHEDAVIRCGLEICDAASTVQYGTPPAAKIAEPEVVVVWQTTSLLISESPVPHDLCVGARYGLCRKRCVMSSIPPSGPIL